MGFLERAVKKDQDTLERANEAAKKEGTGGWFDAASGWSIVAWSFGTYVVLLLAKKTFGATLAYILCGVIPIVVLVVSVLRQRREGHHQRWLGARDKQEP